jgi:hypothetical protein
MIRLTALALVSQEQSQSDEGARRRRAAKKFQETLERRRHVKTTEKYDRSGCRRNEEWVLQHRKSYLLHEIRRVLFGLQANLN